GQSGTAKDGAIEVELIEGTDPGILITMTEFGDLPLLMSVSGSQILVDTLLWPVADVGDSAAFNTMILKSRAPARHQDVEPLLRGLSLPNQDFRTNRETLDQFQFYSSAIMARPAILIRYLRKAYEAETENRVRITFDRELCYKISTEPKVTLSGDGWRHNYLTLKGVVLEIKFTSRFPLWLSRLVATFNLKARSISKYTTGIQQSMDLGFCGPLVR
ncbi:MAG: DUF2170 family protein, partial [Planctomycetes bacterium]|nr:DUF2170 family protein [Planctomycetota bacterium]